MKTQHTPAPWRYDPNEGVIFAGASGICPAVAIVRIEGTEYFDVDPIEGAHNARLIAQAPALLAALETITEHAQETYPHFESERGQREIREALEVIKAVKGGVAVNH